MAFALIIVGFVLLASAVKNSQGDLYKLFSGDFTGPSNFIYWMISILIIGAIGYIPKLKPLSTAFLGLVVLVLFLTKGNPSGIGGGFFAQFTKQVASTQTPQPPASATNSVYAGNDLTANIPAIPPVPDFSTLFGGTQ